MAHELSADRERLLTALREIVSVENSRIAAMQAVADALKQAGPYRWVGLYDVDHEYGTVKNVVWSGPGSPEYPMFPITKGLTGAVVSGRKTVNVGDVASDQRYLSAFGSTRSEIIVPVFDSAGQRVVGTIDIESEKPSAFDGEMQSLVEACAQTIQPLWRP